LTELAFLSPDRVQPSERFKPVLKSSMERRLAEAGAELAERDGWLVATRVRGDEGLSLKVRDVSAAAKIEVRGDLNDVDSIDADVVRITPTRAIVFADFARGAELRAELASRFGSALDLTAALAGLEIEGPGATIVLRRVTEHDLDDLPAAAPVAHIGPCFLMRAGEERYRIFFPQEYGHFLWEVVVDAAQPLGGGPAGDERR
jgi:heterotetrameric sarcosine oxidase gamma subunit